MAKEKKISFYYFLNKDLKSQILDGAEHFPVYVRVAYNNNNTKFFFPLDYKAMYITEEEYNRFFVQRLEPKIKDQIDKFESEIVRIMRFEIKVLGSHFSFKNLSRKQSIYNSNLNREFEKYLNSQLVNQVYQKTNKEEIAAIYSEYLSFWDTFQLVSQTCPDLILIIPTELMIMIKAYIGLCVCDFDGLIDKDKGLRLIDWLNEKMPTRFKDCILNLGDIESYFTYESKKSPVWIVLEKIKIERIEVAKYLNVIDKVIVSVSV